MDFQVDENGELIVTLVEPFPLEMDAPQFQANPNEFPLPSKPTPFSLFQTDVLDSVFALQISHGLTQEQLMVFVQTKWNEAPASLRAEYIKECSTHPLNRTKRPYNRDKSRDDSEAKEKQRVKEKERDLKREKRILEKREKEEVRRKKRVNQMAPRVRDEEPN